MLPTPSPVRQHAMRVLAGLLIAGFFWSIWHSVRALPVLGTDGVLVDFDAFYITGQLARDGRAAEAHDVAVMAAIQHDLVGQQGFMPWTYPPQFDLVTLALPLMPRGIAYGLFTALTLAGYLWALARLAGAQFPVVLLALAPPITVTAMIGQNAFLTGGMMALFCLLTLRGRGAAGWALGLLVIKPHLGVGLGVQALAARRWGVLARALAVVAASSLLATLVFGPDIWRAFLDGVEQAGSALGTQFYPLYRMTSVYAALVTLGVPPDAALWLQIGAGLAACAAVNWAVARGAPLRVSLALACFASALVSPYLYDYDMTITGAGLALIAADVRARASTVEQILLLALVWVAGGWGMIHALASAGLPWEERAAQARATLSFGAFAYLLLLALGGRILRRTAPEADV